MGENIEPCQCPQAGYCERWHRQMDEVLWGVCQDGGEMGERYRKQWTEQLPEQPWNKPLPEWVKPCNCGERRNLPPRAGKIK